MNVELHESLSGKMLVLKLSGKLDKDDYQTFVPHVEKLIRQHGKIRMLVELHDFHGWTAGGLWEDIKFDLHHFSDIERLAIVGDKRWEHGMAVFCKPFTTADIRYFDASELAEARHWIGQDVEVVL